MTTVLGIRPVDGRVRKWHFRVFVSSTSWPRHYGLHVGEDRFGGMGEHYGYPWTRIGLFALCGHRCWFAGWELEKPNAGDVPRRGSDVGTSPLLGLSGSED